MADQTIVRVSEAAGALLHALAGVTHYAPDGIPDIPMPAELALLGAIERSVPVAAEEVASIRSGLTLWQGYLLLCFALRMGVYAVHTNNRAALYAGTFGLVADGDLVDWKDVLIYLSIVEDCASRLGTDLESAVRPHIHLASEERRETIAEYVSREPEMRGLGVMRVAVSGSGSTLAYRQLS